MDTPVSGTPRLILRLEGLAVLVFSIVGYKSMHGSWLMFALLLFVPDVSLAGYALNARVGAAAYNAFHTYVAPAVLAAVGAATGSNLLPICLIWMGHIGMDRALGLGLKFATAFESTHLGSVGRKPGTASALIDNRIASSPPT
jgi:hypothetical protein